jgi:hypothetical protein
MIIPVMPTSTGTISERPPVPEPELVQQEVGAESAQHVLGAVREVDDVEEPEDDREPQR